MQSERDLPAEIRNDIYNLSLVGNQHTIYIVSNGDKLHACRQTRTEGELCTESRRVLRKKMGPASIFRDLESGLLLVSKPVRKEANPVLYGQRLSFLSCEPSPGHEVIWSVNILWSFLRH